MKKLILIILMIFAWGCDGERPKRATSMGRLGSDLVAKCVGNYVFVVYGAGYAGGLTQFMIDDNGRTRPLKCDELTRRIE